MPPPVDVQVIVRTALVSSKSPTLVGLSSLASLIVTFQPGLVWAVRKANGVSCGNVTTSLVVEAVSDSFGTRKTALPKPPWVASVEDDVDVGERRDRRWPRGQPSRSAAESRAMVRFMKECFL